MGVETSNAPHGRLSTSVSPSKLVTTQDVSPKKCPPEWERNFAEMLFKEGKSYFQRWSSGYMLLLISY